MKFPLFILILFFSLSVKAQDVNHFAHIGIAANAYKGDLQDTYDKWTSSFNAGILFNKKKRVNGAFSIGIGNLTGQNLNPVFKSPENLQNQPNKFFRTSFFTAQYDLQINIVKTEHWTLFVSQGLGIIRYNPKDEENQALQVRSETRAPSEDYNNISVMFPTQIGCAYKLKNNYGFRVQTGLLNTLTDYLDNISELGSKSGNDNVLGVRFSLLVPISY